MCAEPWICSCLDGSTASVPSVPSAGTRGQHPGSHWGSHSSLSLITCAALTLWFLTSMRSSWGLLVFVLRLLKDYFPRKSTKLSNTSVLQGHPKKGPQFSLCVLWVFFEMFLQESGKITGQLELGRIRQIELLQVLKEALENCFFWTVTESWLSWRNWIHPLLEPLSSLLRDVG